MVRFAKKISVLLLSALVLVPIIISYTYHIPQAASSGTLTFLAAGDWGYNSDTKSNWASIHNSGADFVLALGDLSYTSNAERNWCNDFKAQFNNVEFIVGNHDTDQSGPGDFAAYQQYCPYTLSSPIHYGVENPSGSSTSYGAEYYFDYPATSPIARFILIAPGISGHLNFDYSAGTPHYNWVSNSVDGARASGIPWVVVGMHKNCLTTGTGHTGCETGTDIQDLLLSKRVDLVLNGHEHNYERSKQLACADNNNYIASCVAHDGSSYVKGDGSVIITQGVGGESLYSITSPLSDYFMAGEDSEFGYMKYVLSTTSLTAEFVSVTGSFTDSFTIGSAAQTPLSASFTFAPTNATTTTAVTFSGSAIGGAPPYSYAWNFGDGSTGAGNTVTHTFTATGTFTVLLTVTDSSSPQQSATSSRSITVTTGSTQLSASVTYTPSAPTTNSLLVFTASATGGTGPYTFSWSFNDIGTMAGNPVYRIIQSTGTYTVTLTVTDSSPTPRQATASKTLTVASPALVAGPAVVGWGGVRLDAAAENTVNPQSLVFPTERASDMEMEAARMYAMGFNAFRVSFQSACASPQEMGPYNSTILSRAIMIAQHYNMWIIVDYHGYNDLASDSSANCWLNYWKPIVTDFKTSYSNLIWEPLNEPTAIGDDVVRLSQKYQAWVDQARSIGDNHWIVVQNLCSFGCGLSDFSDGYPAVSDPSGKLFISLHSYMDYGTYSGSWNNSTAESVAHSYYQNVLDGISKRGWPVLNTEGGTDPLITSCSGGVRLPSNRCAPDQILTGSAGYSTTTFDFIQTLANLYDQNSPQRLNWVWWPAGGWTDTPGAGVYGALQCDSNPKGWGCLLNYRMVSSSGGNNPPTLTVMGTQTFNENTLFTLMVNASDSDSGQTVNLSASGLPSGASFPSVRGNPASGTFSWTPSEAQGPGDYTVSFTADDGGGGVVTRAVAIHVNEVNTAPAILTIGDKSVDEQTSLIFTVTATDGDLPANTLTFSLGSGAPTGASLTSAGVFSWTPTESQGPGTYSVRIVVTDNGSPSLSGSQTISIAVREVNLAPIASVPSAQSVNEQTALTFTITASDPDVPANTFALACTDCATIGANFNPSTGQFLWTPTEAQGPADYTVTFKAVDNGSPALTDTKSVSIHVNEVNQSPVLTVLGTQAVDEGSLLTFSVTAADSDAPVNTLTFSIGPDSPQGVDINSNTGVLSWTPSESQGPGDYIVTIKVTDNGSPALSDSRTVMIHVNEINQSPVLTVPGPQSAAIGYTITFTITATDPDIPSNALTLSADPATLPTGATFNAATGAFTWTPQSNQLGQFTVNFKAMDNGTPSFYDVKSVTITVTVTIDQPPSLTAPGPQTVDEGFLLTFQLSATDPDSSSLNLSAMELPTGATFSKVAGSPVTGTFSWTPGEEQGPGDYTVIFYATDGFSEVTRSVTVHVVEVNLPPEVSVAGPRTVDSLSTLTLLINGDDPDIPQNAIVLSASGLVTGMTFDSSTGNFSFIPTQEQQGMKFDITFTAADSGVPPLSNSKTVTLQVNSRGGGPPWESLPYLWGQGISMISGISGISPILLLGLAGIVTLGVRTANLSRSSKRYQGNDVVG